jgi:acetyl-CoA acyltransferase
MNERKKERIAIIDGVRTPFCKGNGVFKDIEAEDLGAEAIKALLAKTNFPADDVDEVIFGNVLQPVNSTNIARVLAVKGGVPESVPAYTVNRNCASGLEAVVSAYNKMLLNHAKVIIAGGTESMSNVPIMYGKKMKEFLMALTKAKSWGQRLGILASFRPSFLKPEIPEIADPLCGLSMGQTAEILSREFKIDREEQDKFALTSQERTVRAQKEGRLAEEINPVALPPKYDKLQFVDDGARENQSLEMLSKLKPVFDPYTGTVTAANSSPITDGAAALLLMTESEAKARGYKPLGYIRDYSYAALSPSRMGLGPAHAIAKLLTQNGLKLSDIDLIEINEAFAAQVLSVIKALDSKEFCKKELGLDQPVGKIDLDKLNVNGGAIAIGHPLGASGARLVLTLLKELNRRNQKRGIAALCIGGGQGEGILLEVE